MSILEIKDLTYKYSGSGTKIVLNEISAQFEEGVFYAILGMSGSGKTTLLSLLAGLDQAQSGELLYRDQPIQKIGLSQYRKQDVSLVFQNYNLIDYMTPLENMKLVNDKAHTNILLELGLHEDEINRNVLKLSGGQQQRAALGRSLASPASIILADEPTGNLDSDTADDIIQILMRSAHEHHKCVIVVTHSKQLAKKADVLLLLKEGKLYKV